MTKQEVYNKLANTIHKLFDARDELKLGNSGSKDKYKSSIIDTIDAMLDLITFTQPQQTANDSQNMMEMWIKAIQGAAPNASGPTKINENVSNEETPEPIKNHSELTEKIHEISKKYGNERAIEQISQMDFSEYI